MDSYTLVINAVLDISKLPVPLHKRPSRFTDDFINFDEAVSLAYRVSEPPVCAADIRFANFPSHEA